MQMYELKDEKDKIRQTQSDSMSSTIGDKKPLGLLHPIQQRTGYETEKKYSFEAKLRESCISQ